MNHLHYAYISQSPLLKYNLNHEEASDNQLDQVQQTLDPSLPQDSQQISSPKQSWKLSQHPLWLSSHSASRRSKYNTFLRNPINVLAVNYSPLDELRYSLASTQPPFKTSLFKGPSSADLDLVHIRQVGKLACLSELQKSLKNCSVAYSGDTITTIESNRINTLPKKPKNGNQPLGIAVHDKYILKKKKKKFAQRFRRVLKSLCYFIDKNYRSVSPGR